ncbi:MAG: hypothetical protein COB50_02280 [Thiotrichales bacterium]|nr:MAG: hypothetical protein COB50_02280 [Thiotrichales bacterium]
MPDVKSTNKSLAELQKEFTSYIRNPDDVAIPKNMPKRISIYKELLYNNILGLLENAFPVLHSVLAANEWGYFVKNFFAHHHSVTPIFYKIPAEFVDYLLALKFSYEKSWIFELAHFEYLELKIELQDGRILWNKINVNGDLLKEKPAVTPFMELAKYHFAVDEINEDFFPKQPHTNPIYFVIYRDLADKVDYLEINDFSARLIQLLCTKKLTGKQTLELIIEESNHTNYEMIVTHGKKLIEEFKDLGIILGTYK